ncbi:inositol 1,4,5-trisphosphate receptor-interacting protein-like 1, partial [Passer montanus]|uniref:inositol 1,4,5-trisphosphate receptor-interacting protein-like 1 n=1 Tax=Passer montanus TaxID=9160 RepID=UPI00195F6341
TMEPMVFLFMLLKSLIQYPQHVADALDEETRLRMEARAKHLEWERIHLEQEVEQLTQEQLKQVEEDEQDNRGADEEEAGNVVAANEEDNVGNEDVNEAAVAENNNDAANEVQEEEEDDFDDFLGEVAMEHIQWPVQDLQRGCEWITDLMDNYTIFFGHVLANSFYPVLQRAIGVGSAFEGWSPREQDVVYSVLIPMTPPRGHSFHLELESEEQRHVRNFRVRVQLECTCSREQQAEDMLCFLHHPEEELSSNQDPSLLDTLCTGSYLDVQKTARWFYQLVRAVWPALPQSHNWHLRLMPSTRSCQFQVSYGQESFRIELFFGVRRGDSAIFVCSQPREAYTASTTWPESYAVAEVEFFKHIARQAPPDSLHLKCLQFFTRLSLGFSFSTYTMKTIVMHLLNITPVSEWRRRDLVVRLLDIINSLQLCLRAKCLHHFIVGNQRLPQDIHLPADVQRAEPYNLLQHLAQQPAAHAHALYEYHILYKWPLATAPLQVSAGSRAGTQRLQEGAPGEGPGERWGQECRHEGSKRGLACPCLRQGAGRALRPCQLQLGALQGGRQRAVGSRSSAALTAEAAARAQPAGDTRPARGHPQGDPALGPAQAAAGSSPWAQKGGHEAESSGPESCRGGQKEEDENRAQKVAP